MDSKLKERFFDFIEQIHPDRIILFITHDFSNIDCFHEVLFIHDAKILAGNHDHLIKENVNYRKMFTKEAETD
jgi:ABC-type transport system involved in cytochrome bd biosynthesis fused ATPase/permease subunit